jgi:hypothetical protein
MVREPDHQQKTIMKPVKRGGGLIAVVNELMMGGIGRAADLKVGRALGRQRISI